MGDFEQVNVIWVKIKIEILNVGIILHKSTDSNFNKINTQ